MITESEFKSMSLSLSLIVDLESSVRLLQERVKLASSLNQNELLSFITEEIDNTINIIDKKIYDVLLDERLSVQHSPIPSDTCSDEK